MELSRIVVIFILHSLCFLNFAFCQEESGTEECDFQTSETNSEEQLQPPNGCMSGSFTWYNPSGSVNISFPRSLLPSESRGRMRVCLRHTDGAEVTDIFHLVSMGRRRGQSRKLRLYLQPADGAEADPWSCSRLSGGGVKIVLYAKKGEVEQDQFQELEYKIEVIQPNQPRPNRGRGTNRDNRRGNRRPNREHGGKNTFPLEHGEYPMRSNPGDDPENPEARSSFYYYGRGY